VRRQRSFFTQLIAQAALWLWGRDGTAVAAAMTAYRRADCENAFDVTSAKCKFGAEFAG
jgi:hypothetical protein